MRIAPGRSCAGRTRLGAIAIAVHICAGSIMQWNVVSASNMDGRWRRPRAPADPWCQTDLRRGPDARHFPLETIRRTAVAVPGTPNVPVDVPLSRLAGANDKAIEEHWSPRARRAVGDGNLFEP